MATVAYNPNDATQTALLAAIRSGESNGSPNPYQVGYGGVDLSRAPAGAAGFPVWAGAVTSHGATHAAGAYQFQPATWQEVAGPAGLNFANPGDQDAAAWALAQQRYTASTGGDLTAALQGGQDAQVAAALAPTWTSLGNGGAARIQTAAAGGTPTAAPDNSITGQLKRLFPGQAAVGGALVNPAAAASNAAAAIASGTTGFTQGAAASISGWVDSIEKSVASTVQATVSNVVTAAENWISRGFLVLLGIVIVGVALYMLMKSQGILPSNAKLIQEAA